MMEHVLITGGTGFVGKSLLERAGGMVDEGRLGKITVVSRNPGIFLEKYPTYRDRDWLSVEYGDVLKYETLPTQAEFSHVIHAATESTNIRGMENLEVYRQIEEGTRNILRLSAQKKGTRFLLTSSGAVYGETVQKGSDRFEEGELGRVSIGDGRSAYALGKRSAEFLCTLYRDSYGLDTIVARCFAFIGPYLPLTAHYAIGNFIYDALYKETIRVQSSGLAVRSYLDQSDMAEWLWVLLEEGKSGEAYNVGSDCQISIKELAMLVRDVVSPGKEVVIEGCDNKEGTRAIYVPSVEKIKIMHGLRQRLMLEESIRRTAISKGKEGNGKSV